MYGTRQNLTFLSALLLATSATAQTPLVLRVGLVTRVNPVSAASIARGVQLGAAEAEETAKLFGASVLLFEQRTEANAETAAATLLAQRKVQVLIGSSPEDADALSRFADKHGLIFINAASRAPALRTACRRYTFHVEASDSMYANAARRGVGSNAAATPSTLLWASSLEKYGASQINDRFRTRYHSPMNGSAWAGWVAVKIAAEAALRARSVRPTALLAYLESPSTSFDGHKGWPLSFRSTDHQLRQPLYLVGSSPKMREGIQDIPALSSLATGGADVSQLLDALMPRSTPRCAWNRS